MKSLHKSKKSPLRTRTKKLTLGDLIAATYNACGPQGAPKLLKLAIESQMVRFAPKPVF